MQVRQAPRQGARRRLLLLHSTRPTVRVLLLLTLSTRDRTVRGVGLRNHGRRRRLRSRAADGFQICGRPGLRAAAGQHALVQPRAARLEGARRQLRLACNRRTLRLRTMR